MPAMSVALAAIAVATGGGLHGTSPAASLAAGGITATGVRLGDHPAFVRAVVDFSGGTLTGRQIEATSLTSATATVRVSSPNIRAAARARRADGISVRVTQGRGAIGVGIRFVRGRIKYLSYAVVSGSRLAIDLWKSAPPSRAAEARGGARGCLTLDRWRVRSGVVDVTGREHNIFEHQFQLVVRGSAGGVLGRRAVHGTGRWSSRVAYRASRREPGTLEAVALSAKDVALACLAQVRVALAAVR